MAGQVCTDCIKYCQIHYILFVFRDSSDTPSVYLAVYKTRSYIPCTCVQKFTESNWT